MSHQHTCLTCDAILGEGGDCEFDEDHPYQDCEACVRRNAQIDAALFGDNLANTPSRFDR